MDGVVGGYLNIEAIRKGAPSPFPFLPSYPLSHSILFYPSPLYLYPYIYIPLPTSSQANIVEASNVALVRQYGKGFHVKRECPLRPSEIKFGWNKLKKSKLLKFGPKIVYSMLINATNRFLGYIVPTRWDSWQTATSRQPLEIDNEAVIFAVQTSVVSESARFGNRLLTLYPSSRCLEECLDTK